MVLFSYVREDEGNCRVYYRSTGINSSGRRYLYCIQNDGGWGKDDYTFYSCSLDGEPSHKLMMPLVTRFDRKVLPRSVVK